MKTIRYIIYALLLLVLFAGCSKTELPIEEEELVAIELVGLNGSVQVSRAGIDPSLTAIENATIIVFDGTEDKVLHRRTIKYTDGERVYLKRGGTYRVFVIANLVDANCPDDYTAETYFDDVTNIAHLNNKYFISSAEPGKAPTKMPMISGSKTSPFAVVTLNNPIQTTTVTLKLRSLYSKMEVNIYNLVDASGNNLSSVELLSCYSNNLPAYSWIVERHTTIDEIGAKDDYPQSLTPVTAGYNRSSLTDIRRVVNHPIEEQPPNRYEWHYLEVYCLENRRGTVANLNAKDRKAKAPKFAFEFNFQGNAEDNEVLQTYVLVGKGYENSTPLYGNFDIDRNCIYRVNVYVDGVSNVQDDSRRMYLNVVISGDLESPEDGEDIYEF
ncbi:hypothetical protein [Parabacteroides sp. PFB2-10]|uniref:hypothetical protein n=1 Tax=Parabacteroides sp. PFB2-10 TaxID=1742405 RepID=UPI0024740923|nr:hypothetical protein [Parabacteroides sp. PFB2-10]MDL2245297.1 hypothetical protein [Parabacteroides sp. OttesenSCG-928-J18]